MNKMLLVGRLVKDPERGKGEHPKARFRIAVDRAYKREGEPQSDFFDVIVFGKTAECVLNYLSKGRLVAIDGRAQWRSWETAEKEKKKVFEVIANEISFLDAKPKDPAARSAGWENMPAQQPAPVPSNPAESMEIPDFGIGFDLPDFDLMQTF